MTSSSMRDTQHSSTTVRPDRGGRFVIPLDILDDVIWSALDDLEPYLISIEMLITDAFLIFATDAPGSFLTSLNIAIEQLEHRYGGSVDPRVVGPYDFNELYDILHEITMTLIGNLSTHFTYVMAQCNIDRGYQPTNWHVVRLAPHIVAIEANS